jgi:fumarate reductase subunit C
MLKFVRFLFAFLFWVLLIGGIAAVIAGAIFANLFADFLENPFLDLTLLSLGIYAIFIALFSLLPLYCIVGLYSEVKAIRRQLKKNSVAVPAAPVNNQTETVDFGGANYKIFKLE